MSQVQNIQAAFDNTVEMRVFKFRFNADKLGNRRPAVELSLPVPSVEGIVAILQKGGKGLDLLLDVVADTIRTKISTIVGEDENISQENFPMEKISWEMIANAPRAERKSIPESVWEAFCKDYIEIMPGLTRKSLEAVTNATTLYLKKFSLAKTNKEILAKMKEQLAIYMENSPKAEEFTDILELLISRADAYLSANDTEKLLGNL